MRVALDTNGIYMAQAGVARYIRGLLHGIRQAAIPGLDLREFAWPVENFSYQQPQRALKTFYREIIWAKLLAPPALKKQQADLLHSTCGVMVVPPRSVKHVVTLHDLAVLRTPTRFRAWQRRAAAKQLQLLPQADRIICVSRFTAEEAIQLLGLPANRMEVVHNGCEFHPDEPAPKEHPPSEKLPAEFLLFVGSLEPGKNLSLLKQAYRLAAAKNKVLPPLVIIGARWEGVDSEGAPPANWHYLGRQPDEVLVYAYRRALALVFPSRYEGFGFPIAEAMALGCPVICSTIASLPEVAGKAALFASLDPAAYLEAISRVVNDNVLRQELIDKGRQQSEQFSWRKCAEQTVAVYHQAAP
jgi:glycosyltransferase involved in cell wall biosynthesis